jgi:oligopeptide/dipeptide ABC transporter ATP-binding protein
MNAGSPDTLVLSIQKLTVMVAGHRRPAVDSVNVSVQRSEIVGIVGESGSGKTLTALAAMGLLPRAARVIAGSISFCGEDLLALPERKLRAIRGNRLAMIFQDPSSSTNPLLRVGDQVAEPLVVHRSMDWSSARSAAINLLRQVHIPAAAERSRAYPHEFSGGMLQRASLAAALACEPALIIADEPTTALDVTIQAEILQLLREIRDKHGTAILLITHDLGVVAELCDSMIVMYAGRVMETGPVSQVFRRPAHPYTQALLRATPRIDSDGGIQAIPGQMLATSEPAPKACRFGDRCPHRFDRCAIEPDLLPVLGSQEARCWLNLK